jgi:RHS repeat-associated protein
VTKTVDQSYDFQNQWVRRTVDSDGPGPAAPADTFFSYFDGQVQVQYDGSADTDLSHRYLWADGVDQLLADETVTSLTAPGTVQYPLGDQIGTLRDLATHNSTTHATTVANHRRYDDYGNVVSESNAAVDQLFGYTGRAYDDSTGLQSNLNRWYSPKTGRWMSEDPIGFSGHDTDLSRYVGNSPTQLIDPSGYDGAITSFAEGAVSEAAGIANTVNPVEIVNGGRQALDSRTYEPDAEQLRQYRNNPLKAAEAQGLRNVEIVQTFVKNRLTTPRGLGQTTVDVLAFLAARRLAQAVAKPGTAAAPAKGVSSPVKKAVNGGGIARAVAEAAGVPNPEPYALPETAPSPKQWLRGRYVEAASKPGAYQASGGRVFPTQRNSALRGPALRAEQQRFFERGLADGKSPGELRGQAASAGYERRRGINNVGGPDTLADRGAESALQRAIQERGG